MLQAPGDFGGLARRIGLDLQRRSSIFATWPRSTSARAAPRARDDAQGLDGVAEACEQGSSACLDSLGRFGRLSEIDDAAHAEQRGKRQRCGVDGVARRVFSARSAASASSLITASSRSSSVERFRAIWTLPRVRRRLPRFGSRPPAPQSPCGRRKRRSRPLPFTERSSTPSESGRSRLPNGQNRHRLQCHQPCPTSMRSCGAIFQIRAIGFKCLFGCMPCGRAGLALPGMFTAAGRGPGPSRQHPCLSGSSAGPRPHATS